MKKRKIILVIILLLIPIAMYTAIKIENNNKKYNYLYQIYEENNKDVNKAISLLISNKSYLRLSKDEQVISAKKLLKLYEKDKRIKNLEYDNKKQIYTFIYEDEQIGRLKLKGLEQFLK